MLPGDSPGAPPGLGNRARFDPEDGPGPGFLNAPGQATRTVGAVMKRDGSLDAGVITSDGGRATVSATAQAQLAAVRPDRRPQTVELDGLGSYRLVALHARRGGETIVTGLPTAGVDHTLLWVVGMFCVVAAVALLAATTAGFLIIRRQLAPLSRVSAAARDVADLDLDRGEVQLPTPIVRVDPAGAHTEVGQLGSALNRMLDRIAGALSARHASETRVRQFVSDASHELRTPLAAIRGYTELAQRKRDELPDDVAHAMSRVESETERMTHLVEDMLLLARLDEGRPLARESVDLSRLVVDTVSDAHVAGPDHEWSLDLPDEPVLVVGRRGPVAPGAGEPARQCPHAHSRRDDGHDVAGDRRHGGGGADGGRRRAGHPGRVAAGGLRTVRARRLVAFPAAEPPRRRHPARAAARGSGWRSWRRWSRRITEPSTCEVCPGVRNSS